MTNPNMDEMDQGLRVAINTMLANISTAQEDQVNAQMEEEALQLKLEKQKVELERSKERLATLNNVR
jgi:hypothetical protein